MDKEYAKVAWRIEDLEELCPEWDDDQCMEFLINNQRFIREAMIECGWGAIETLIHMDKVSQERDFDGPKKEIMKDYRPIWKALANSKRFDGKDVEQYCILKAMSAKSTEKVAIAISLLQSAFSPITNINRLTNGCMPYHALTTIWGSRGIFADHPLNQCLETLEEKALYASIKKQALEIMGKEYGEYHTFIIVRQDISPEQQMVQSTHAGILLGHHIGFDNAQEFQEVTFPDDVRVHELNLVICGVKNKEAVEGAAEYIHSCGYTIHKFYESDLNNEITAVASGPIPSPKRGIMKRYKLIRFNKGK